MTVAALYVETNGVYYGLDDVDPWDEKRDARLYAGPWPVVAHPPCQRWCRFAKGIAAQYPEHQVGDDGGCFEQALEAVLEFGGVLEHPAGSLAWDKYELPKPQSTTGWTTSLTIGGASCYVEQGRYGNPMRKATWLYAYDVDLPSLLWGRRIDSERGEFKWGSKLYKPASNHERPRIDSQHSITTPEFRDALLDMARSAGQGHSMTAADVQLDIFGHEIPTEALGTSCTNDEDCRTEADEHEPDCPVEQRLLDELGF